MSSVWFPPAGVNRGRTRASQVVIDATTMFGDEYGQAWKSWTHAGLYFILKSIKSGEPLKGIDDTPFMNFVENENLFNAAFDLLSSLFEMHEARLAKFEGMTSREIGLLNTEIGQKFDNYELIRKLVVEDSDVCMIPRII